MPMQIRGKKMLRKLFTSRARLTNISLMAIQSYEGSEESDLQPALKLKDHCSISEVM